MVETSLVGHLSRKRPLSKRLLFLDVEVTDAGTSCLRAVVVKEECSGVGGAAIARSTLKLGDLVAVQGKVESDGTLLARHIVIQEAWRDVGGGAAWAPQHDLAEAPAVCAQDGASSVELTSKDGAAASSDLTPQDSRAVAELPVCHAWLNTGRCGRTDCKFRHESADVTAERKKWVAERRERRLQLAALNDPTDPHEKRSHAQRAAEYAKWLLATFGNERLAAGSGVLDVAGGRGALSFELSMAGVCSTLVEDREAPPTLDRKQRKRMRRAEAGNGGASAAGGGGGGGGGDGGGGHGGDGGGDGGVDDDEALTAVTDVFQPVDPSEPCQPVDPSELCQPVDPSEECTATAHSSGTGLEVMAEEHPERGAGGRAAAADLPFRFLQERFDERFVRERSDLLCHASLLVGLHPDQVSRYTATVTT